MAKKQQLCISYKFKNVNERKHELKNDCVKFIHEFIFLFARLHYEQISIFDELRWVIMRYEYFKVNMKVIQLFEFNRIGSNQPFPSPPPSSFLLKCKFGRSGLWPQFFSYWLVHFLTPFTVIIIFFSCVHFK